MFTWSYTCRLWGRQGQGVGAWRGNLDTNLLGGERRIRSGMCRSGGGSTPSPPSLRGLAPRSRGQGTPEDDGWLQTRSLGAREGLRGQERSREPLAVLAGWGALSLPSTGEPGEGSDPAMVMDGGSALLHLPWPESQNPNSGGAWLRVASALGKRVRLLPDTPPQGLSGSAFSPHLGPQKPGCQGPTQQTATCRLFHGH